MGTKFIFAALLSISSAVMAMENNSEDSHSMDGHGDASVFHAFKLKAQAGEGKDESNGRWDMDGWIGTDENKLWLRAEGENIAGRTDQSELWALYSRNVDTFWDMQAGFRHDTEPDDTSYAVVGFKGLAPYFFETDAHLFVSDHGDVSVRLREENDFLFTQRLILQPYLELNWFAQDVREQEKGVGLSSGELGFQLRYEITRKLAPYFDLRYERSFGKTASFENFSWKNNEDLIGSIGVQFLF